jgi:hypothetical protein
MDLDDRVRRWESPTLSKTARSARDGRAMSKARFRPDLLDLSRWVEVPEPTAALGSREGRGRRREV